MDKRNRARVPNVRTAIVGAILVCLVGLAMPVAAARHEARIAELDRFMWGLAGQESGWNYYVRNPYSGAFGRYQIMPANWGSWARRYIGPGWNDESPLNQELVARGKLKALYHWLGDWKRVAYWWLTGSTAIKHSKWSATGRRYVANVMSLMSRAPKGPATLPTDPSEATGMPVNAGDWRVTDKPARIRSNPKDGYRVIGHTVLGESFRVLSADWNRDHDVLRIRITSTTGKTGWVNATKTLPAQAPRKS